MKRHPYVAMTQVGGYWLSDEEVENMTTEELEDMSANGDSTRDWLLKKLLKASRNLAEQQTELEHLKARLHESDRALFASRESHREDLLDLHSRIHEMAPEKQFEVLIENWKDSGLAFNAAITSVESTNGRTKITIRLPRA